MVQKPYAEVFTLRSSTAYSAPLRDRYLRPETAQGIFINYKYCLEQNNNRVPFGVAQVTLLSC